MLNNSVNLFWVNVSKGLCKTDICLHANSCQKYTFHTKYLTNELTDIKTSKGIFVLGYKKSFMLNNCSI
jgi:hypothetical protein